MEIPRYMNQGSEGPHVTLVQVVLCGVGMGEHMTFDGYYSHLVAAKVKRMQELLHIEADGNFGPVTRQAVKDVYGLDFAAACQTIPGVTVFVQPDGQEISWGPDSV